MTDRATPSLRLSLAVTLVAGAAFVAVAALVVPWHWLPGQHVVAVPADQVFSAAQIDRGEHVSGLLRHAAWGNLLVSLLVAGMLGFTRWGSALVSRLRGPWWVKVVLGCLAVSAVGAVASVPLAWRAQRVELAEGLSHQPWASWLTDQGTGLAVTWAFTSVALLVVVGLARLAPRTWPLWAAVAAAALAMLGSFLYPVVVEPLFNDFTPMTAGPMRSDIFDLAKTEHVHIDDVLVADASRRTTTLNAYVSGFGSTRRVVVYDTVLKDLPRDQILAIVAHELGHAHHDDVLVGSILAALGTAAGIGLLGLALSAVRRRPLARGRPNVLGDPTAVPLLLALVAIGMFLSSPIDNGLSRKIETRADVASLEATRDPAAFIRMQRALDLHSLSDTPVTWSQFWFGSHPTTLQRIAIAEQLGRRMGMPGDQASLSGR